MRSWLEQGAIPDDDTLEMDLISPEYGSAADHVSIQLERKKDMKRRGLASPDAPAALACTFAMPVAPRMVDTGPVQLHGLRWGDPNNRRRFARDEPPDI